MGAGRVWILLVRKQGLGKALLSDILRYSQVRSCGFVTAPTSMVKGFSAAALEGPVGKEKR